jgi:hypothetical protein
MQGEIKTGKTIDQMQMKLDLICQFSKWNRNFHKSFFRAMELSHSTLRKLKKEE